MPFLTHLIMYDSKEIAIGWSDVAPDYWGCKKVDGALGNRWEAIFITSTWVVIGSNVVQ